MLRASLQRFRDRSPSYQAARERLELRLGEAQLRSMRWALSRVVGLRRGAVTLPTDVLGEPVTMPYLWRGPLDGRGGEIPLVLVHGFGGDKETWLMLSSALPRRRPLLMIDLPGFGEADPVPRGAATPRTVARALGACLDALGTGPMLVVGSSMGGAVSLCLAHARPERVRGLVLINSLGPRHARMGSSDYARALERGDNLLIPGDAASGQRMLGLVMARPPRLPRSLMRYAASQRVAMRERLGAMFRDLVTCPADSDVPADLSHLVMPALVMCGARDRVIDPAVSRSLAAALPRAELHSFPDLGHMPQLEAPLRTARILSRFLANTVR